MDANRKRKLRREQASRYLKDEHQIHNSTETLAKKAVNGGGPAFCLIGRLPFYDTVDLDAYAASITSAKVTSTSELRQRRRPRKNAQAERAAGGAAV